MMLTLSTSRKLVLGNVRERVHGPDPGVGHCDVESAEGLHALGHQPVQRGLLADVARVRDDPPTQRLDFLDRDLEVSCGADGIGNPAVRRAVEGEDVRPFLREADGVCSPLTSGRSGDQSDLSFHASHVHSSSKVFRLRPAGLARPRVVQRIQIEASPAWPDQLEKNIDSGRLGPDMCGIPHQNRCIDRLRAPRPSDGTAREFRTICVV